MPRFNWRLLFEPAQKGAVLVLGNLQDGLDAAEFADQVYLYDCSSASLPEQGAPGSSLRTVTERELPALQVETVIVHLRKGGRSRVETVRRRLASSPVNVAYQFHGSSLSLRLLQVARGLCRRGGVVYFPYRTFDHNDFVDLFREGGGLKQMRTLLKHSLARSDFGVYLPHGSGRCNIDAVVHAAGRSNGLDLPTPSRVRSGSTGSFVVDLGAEIIRVPFSREARFCENNYRVISELSAWPLPFRVPEPIAAGWHGANRYFVESKLDGASLDLFSIDAAATDAVYRQALGFLSDPRLRSGCIDKERAGKMFELELSGVAPFLDDAQRAMYAQVRRAFGGLFDGGGVPLLVTHGDFKNSNFLVGGDTPRVEAVIDWEFSPLHWFPLYDFMVLTAHRFGCVSCQLDVVRFASRLCHGYGDARAGEFLRQYLNAWELDPGFALPLTLACAMRHMNVNYEPMEKERAEWQELFKEQVDPMARRFLAATGSGGDETS